MELPTLDWDTIVRALTTIVSFGIAARVCTFHVQGRKRRLGVSIIAWFIMVFSTAQGVTALFTPITIPLSSLGISCVLLYAVIVTKGNIAPILRSEEDVLAKKTV